MCKLGFVVLVFAGGLLGVVAFWGLALAACTAVAAVGLQWVVDAKSLTMWLVLAGLVAGAVLGAGVARQLLLTQRFDEPPTTGGPVRT